MNDNRSRCWCGKWHLVAPKVKEGQKKHTSMAEARLINRREGLR